VEGGREDHGHEPRRALRGDPERDGPGERLSQEREGPLPWQFASDELLERVITKKYVARVGQGAEFERAVRRAQEPREELAGSVEPGEKERQERGG
jgi:hypothetical protein